MKFSFQRQHTRKARASERAAAKEAKKAARLAAAGAWARTEKA